MSQMTNYMENRIADWHRGQGLTLPAAWHFAALTADSDSSPTEATGVGLVRFPLTRSLANYAGTQGDGTTLASNGTSHTTSNNVEIDCGTASGSVSVVGVGLYDASSGGNCWMRFIFDDAIDLITSDDLLIAEAAVKFSLGLSGGMSDYLANKAIDLIFRAQSYSFPASLFAALMAVAPTNAGGGTEVGGGVGYSRAEIDSTLTDWSGTQSAGSTIASSGSSGRISNNATLAHPQPTGSWGTPPAMALYDGSGAANLMYWRALASPATIGASSPPPTYAADDLGVTFA